MWLGQHRLAGQGLPARVVKLTVIRNCGLEDTDQAEAAVYNW
jgi:hypothetical protein